MAIKHWLAKHRPKSTGQMRTTSEALNRDFKLVRGLRKKELRYAYCDVRKAGLSASPGQHDLTWQPLRVVPRGSVEAGLSEWRVEHRVFALCTRFMLARGNCDECPLTQVRGVPCTQGRVGEDVAPWVAMQFGNPSPMLAIMQTAIEVRRNNRVRDSHKEDSDAD